MDDGECLKILEIRDDTERKKKAEDFKAKVLSEAEKVFKSRSSQAKKDYCGKMLNIAEGVLTTAQNEIKMQNELLQQLTLEVTDEKAIDLERENALIITEKLSILNSIAFDS